MSDVSTRKLLKTSFAIPFTQFDWGDYYADTDYLTFEEHGIYWNLLRRYYTSGPFHQDLKDLKRKMRCPFDDDTKLLTILEEFFYIAEDECWHHKRCDEEIMRVKGISIIQSQRARRSVQSRKRDSSGKFIMDDIKTPATAGIYPAIKEEDIKLRIQDEEQELRKTLRIQYEEEYKDETNEDDRERYITQDIEGDVRQWKLSKARAKF